MRRIHVSLFMLIEGWGLEAVNLSGDQGFASQDSTSKQVDDTDRFDHHAAPDSGPWLSAVT